MHQVRRSWKHARGFFFAIFLQKLLCQYYFPTKENYKKLMQSQRIARYIFPWLKKMPLNILQQKLQIYTQTGSSRGQWSHWFAFSPPCSPATRHIALKQFGFHDPDLIRTWAQDYGNGSCQRKQEDPGEWNKRENRLSEPSVVYNEGVLCLH